MGRVLAPAAEDILKGVCETYGVGKDELLINSLIIKTTLIRKIPPNLPLQREGFPLFGKEGRGEIFRYLCQFNFETLNRSRTAAEAPVTEATPAINTLVSMNTLILFTGLFKIAFPLGPQIRQ